MLATALEIVAKKLIDILGNKAAKLSEIDKTRAASYEAYYALRRIEESFTKLINSLEDPPMSWSSSMSEEELEKQRKEGLGRAIEWHASTYNELSEQLESLKVAFEAMEGKFEIYGSFEQAQKVRLYMGADDDVMRALFDYGEMPSDIRDIANNMAIASRTARESIASFIGENYGVSDREDGM